MTDALRIETLAQALAEGGIERLVGVPDSTLPGLGEAWASTGREHLVAANEGSAVAIAAGLAMGGRPAAVYLQNTGLGVALDAFGSLLGPDVLGIPTLWVVGWRGHPDLHDVAHHRWHGEWTEVLCAQAGLDPIRVPTEVDALRRVVVTAGHRLGERSSALLVSPKTFVNTPAPGRRGFGRAEALRILVEALDPPTRLVVGVGYAGRELAQLRSQRRAQLPDSRDPAVDDVLASGGMGHAASLALGLAAAEPGRRVVCIDGDGAAVMHLGAALVVAHRAPPSFVHVILDNGCHESVGGTPTPLVGTDVVALGRALGYRRVVSVADGPALRHALADNAPGPTLLHVAVVAHVDPVPPRPPARPDRPTTPRRHVVGPRLFTPGPGRSSLPLHPTLGVETGSRSPAMTRCTAAVRRALVTMVADKHYTCVPLAGSATTALDAILGSILPRSSRILVVVAGRYGQRIATVAARWGHDVVVLDGSRERPVTPQQLEAALADAHPVDWLSFVHGETSTGVLHPVAPLAAVAQRHSIPIVLDAVGTIGISELHLPALGVDLAFGSGAKGLEGPAGLGLVWARTSRLCNAPAGPSTTLDVAAQWRRLEQDGQFPFTPPTLALRGLEAALEQLAAEGGPTAREARYRRIGQSLIDRLAPAGLRPVIEPAARMPLVLVMEHRHGPVAPLVEALRRDGIELYPAADGRDDRLRIGLVGVTDDDADALVRRVTARAAALSR
ncbi:MAG: aminotransferase class V-fold PLP-dependent enzyme [Myxococcota bacterium]